MTEYQNAYEMNARSNPFYYQPRRPVDPDSRSFLGFCLLVFVLLGFLCGLYLFFEGL